MRVEFKSGFSLSFNLDRLRIVGASVFPLLGLALITEAKTEFLIEESRTGAVRLGHSTPVPGGYRLNRFEMIPFVVDAKAEDPIRLLIGVEGAGAQFVSIDTSQFPGFQSEVLFLEDDGFFPDDVEGDGVFTGHLQPSAAQESFEEKSYLTRELRVLELIVHGNGALDETLVDDVAYSYGVIDRSEREIVVESGTHYAKTERVFNLSRTDMLEGDFPSIGVDQKLASQAVIDLLGDRFDWIVFFNIYNTRAFPVSDFTSVRNHVLGIGRSLFDDSQEFGSQGVLRSVLGLYRKHTDDLTHHMFHTWGVYGLEKLGLRSSLGGEGHWGAFAASGQRSIFGFPAILDSFQAQEDGDFCGPIGSGRMFDWELYLMGLLPAAAVADVTVLSESSFKGFDCAGYVFEGEGLMMLDMPRWIETFGEREPLYPDINRFHAAIVVVADRVLQPVEFDYLERLVADHEIEFFENHDGRASISYALDGIAQAMIRKIETTADGVAITLSGPPGEFHVETSTNLQNWVPLRIPAPTGESILRQAHQEQSGGWFFRWQKE